jgi:uncharacterized membrane protein
LTGRLENAVGRVLRVGVTTSSACLALGLSLSLFAGVAAAGHALVHTGLIILMATPVCRVVVSIGEYAIQRDWTFVLLTSIVLIELLASVVAATHGWKL